jgi:membrane-associated phospholipid phosphatase
LSESFKKALLGWNSYPSGHVRDTTVYSVIIASYIPQLTIPLIAFSLFVGWSRIYVGAHFPSDILAGYLMGFIIGAVAFILTKEIKIIFEKIRHKNDKKTEQN